MSVSTGEALNVIQGLMLELASLKQTQDNNQVVKEARLLVDRYIEQRYKELDALGSAPNGTVHLVLHTFPNSHQIRVCGTLEKAQEIAASILRGYAAAIKGDDCPCFIINEDDSPKDIITKYEDWRAGHGGDGCGDGCNVEIISDVFIQ